MLSLGNIRNKNYVFPKTRWFSNKKLRFFAKNKHFPYLSNTFKT